MKSNHNLLIIFTRNPELGKVKNRLAEEVGNAAALNIYKFLLQHTISVTAPLSCDKAVYYSENLDLQDNWDPAVFQKKLQKGEDLGDRMKNAFNEGFRDGYKNIVIIGSDMYDISSEDITLAFSALEEKEFVIGPAQDGGYYLLGMNSMENAIFKNKNWGTSVVLQQTLQDLKDRNIHLLETRNDVDYLEDIKDEAAFQQFLQHLKI
ncbi:MAG: TIGR04282 family arsenosugar biosynthesis glycosyltransferase [Gillisia sp.]